MTTMPTPSVEYGLLSPIFIVFGVAVAGVLVEAFLSRRARYGAQVILAVGGLIAAFVAVVIVGRQIPPTGRTAVLKALAVDGPTLLLQGAILLVAVLAVIFIAERRDDATARAQRPPRPTSLRGWTPSPRKPPRCPAARPSSKRSAPGCDRPSSSRWPCSPSAACWCSRPPTTC